jgi:hypothetical protein
VKGYKVFEPDWTCRGFQYEVGKTYEEDVTPRVCERGFHFCKKAADCFSYYPFDPKSKVAEVIALGEIDEDEDKCCTNRIQIIREVSWEELLTIANTGDGNSGLRNSGNWNSGNRNSGNWNSGNRNSGNWNSGWHNSGDWNSGGCNSGNWNGGNWNSGDRNSGDQNSGNWNSGNWNSGDWNSGNWNSGNWNSGNCCSGDFNLNDNESGCFCTEESTIRMFDKETNMTFKEWRNSEAYKVLARNFRRSVRWIPSDEMTDDEKNTYPEHKTTGGYLRTQDIKQSFLKVWECLSDDEKDIIRSIPNFDAKKFEQITGIKA